VAVHHGLTPLAAAPRPAATTRPAGSNSRKSGSPAFARCELRLAFATSIGSSSSRSSFCWMAFTRFSWMPSALSLRPAAVPRRAECDPPRAGRCRTARSSCAGPVAPATSPPPSAPRSAPAQGRTLPRGRRSILVVAMLAPATMEFADLRHDFSSLALCNAISISPVGVFSVLLTKSPQ
jgi:hypothetical protein